MASSTEAATPKGDISTHRAPGALDRELYCPRLERLLMGAASELGHRGNLAQVVASIERGGVGGGGEDPNLRMLRLLGATDTRGIDNRVRQLRELEQSFGQLSREHQARALAHYLGTPRSHPTLRQRFGEGQGGLAGVVLYRWQLKHAKGRERAAAAGSTEPRAALELTRALLAPIAEELKALRRLSRASAPIPHLPKPTLRQAAADATPEEPAADLLAKRLLTYAETVAACRAVARFLAGMRSLDIDRQVAALRARQRPLLAEQARLCAALADVAAGPVAPVPRPKSDDPSNPDELALVRHCRSGNLDAAAHLVPAEADVRALHRAWQLVSRKADKQRAKAWVEEGATA